MQLSPPNRVVYNALLITSYHDMYKPALAPHVIGLGIGTALLAEQVAAGTAVIWTRGNTDLVTRNHERPAPTDSLGLWLIEHLSAESESLPVGDWLAYLASGEVDLYTRIAEHMTLNGYMRRTTANSGRWRRKPATAFEPVDPIIANAPLAMLRLPLQRPHEALESRRAFLMGLTEAVGLDKSLYTDIAPPGRERARGAIAALPGPFRALLGHLAAAVAEAAMTGSH